VAAFKPWERQSIDQGIRQCVPPVVKPGNPEGVAGVRTGHALRSNMRCGIYFAGLRFSILLHAFSQKILQPKMGQKYFEHGIGSCVCVSFILLQYLTCARCRIWNKVCAATRHHIRRCCFIPYAVSPTLSITQLTAAVLDVDWYVELWNQNLYQIATCRFLQRSKIALV
jgi:hypothetical protein